MFLPDAQIQPSVAAALHKPDWNTLTAGTTGAAPFWIQIVADAHVQAYNEIVTRLAARGYTLAQILTWDRGPEFEKSLTVFWALNNGAGLEALDDKFLARLDRRDELSGNEQRGIEAVAVTAQGVPLIPAATGAVGLVSSGPFTTTSDSFVPDSQDPRRGQPTEW